MLWFKKIFFLSFHYYIITNLFLLCKNTKLTSQFPKISLVMTAFFFFFNQITNKNAIHKKIIYFALCLQKKNLLNDLKKDHTVNK